MTGVEELSEQAAETELAAHAAKAHDAAGVDVSQIDAMLALSPAERLQMLYETASSLARLIPNADADSLL
jgi:ATP-dependent helicase YprA (DUF1998 family)